jgi:hypothetical protein
MKGSFEDALRYGLRKVAEATNDRSKAVRQLRRRGKHDQAEDLADAMASAQIEVRTRRERLGHFIEEDE